MSPGCLRRLRSSVTDALAVVSDRAAALRALRIGGIDLVEPTLESPDPPAMSGVILAPWPNRVEKATWTFRGRQFRLAVTEPEFGHANHGLLTRTDFEAVNPNTADVLRMRSRIASAVGYPFTVEVEVEYRLLFDGLAVGLTARNRGDDPAPLALGAHPYLRIGHAPTESLTVQIDADAAYTLDATHIPRARFDVTGTPWDLRDGRPVADSPPHATFERTAPRGDLVHSLIAPDGRAVELRAAPDFRWTQLYVARDFPADDGPRHAVAIEPMTAPPNGLRTGAGIRTLQPGQTWRTGFEIRLIGAARCLAAGKE